MISKTLSGAEFAALVDRIRADLVRYAARRVGEDEAENAVQLAILRAYLGLPRYRHINASALYAWVYQKLRSVCTNHQKRTRRVTLVSLEEVHSSLRECDGEDPVERLVHDEAAEEQRRRLREIVARACLSPAERRYLAAYMLDEPPSVTAAAMRVSVETVRNGQRAVLRRLSASGSVVSHVQEDPTSAG